MLLATCPLLRDKPFSIIRETQVELVCRQPNLLVPLDACKRILHAARMLGHVVAAVDQVVAHHVDHVDCLGDVGAVFLCVGNHVDGLAGSGDREDLVLG